MVRQAHHEGGRALPPRALLPGLEAEVFEHEGASRQRGGLGVVVGRRDLDEVHAGELDIPEAAQNRHRLVGRQAARHGRAGAWREGRVEAVDVEGEIGLAPADRADDLRRDVGGLRFMHPVGVQHGHAVRSEIGADEYFSIRPFGEERQVQINRQDLAHIIEARVEEIFRLTLQEIKRSGYDGLLPAGMVLTGGVSALPGIRRVASEVLGIPVRTAKPENLVGLVDRLHSPAYSTSVGLLRWAMTMHSHEMTPGRRPKGEKRMDFSNVKKWFDRLLP